MGVRKGRQVVVRCSLARRKKKEEEEEGEEVRKARRGRAREGMCVSSQKARVVVVVWSCRWQEMLEILHEVVPVSYTHLTLPTICSV
eukprot:1132597-Rhodomonas_salina.1